MKEEKSINQNEYPILTLNNQDPLGLNIFYQAKSVINEKLIFDKVNWLIHHVCTDANCCGGLPGHSLIVVEGLLPNNNHRLGQSQPKVLIGYYHLVRSLDFIDQSNNIYRVKKRESDHHYLKKFYSSAKTWPVMRKNAMNMINQIHNNQAIEYSVAGKYSLLLGDGKSHNCTSWALEQLNNAGITDAQKHVNLLKNKPKYLTDSECCLIL